MQDLALEVMPDHVHLFLLATPQASPNLLIGQIKGFSSRTLRQEFPEVVFKASYTMDTFLFCFNTWACFRQEHRKIYSRPKGDLMRTTKYRIYPSRTQQDMLWKQSVLLTHLYNQFLEKKIEAYKSKGITLSRYDLQKLLPQLKKEHPEYKEIHSQVLQQVPKRLNDTYNSFFKRKFGFPNFRASRFFFGLVYPQNTGCRLQDGKVLWERKRYECPNTYQSQKKSTQGL